MRKEYDFSRGTRGNPVMVRKAKKDPQYYELFLEVSGEFPGIEVTTNFSFDKSKLYEYYLIGPATHAEIEEKSRLLLELLLEKVAILQNKDADRASFSTPTVIIRAASEKIIRENNL